MDCIIDSAAGIYIPQEFCQSYNPQDWGFNKNDQDWETCRRGPDEEYYWDSWDTILSNAHITLDGQIFTLYQDSDLFLVGENEEIAEY